MKTTTIQNPFKKTIYQNHILNLKIFINIILQYKKHLSKLKSKINTLTQKIKKYKIIKSIPNIKKKITTTIISKIKKINQFNHPKKLITFTKINPNIFKSNKFTTTKNQITKHNSNKLHHTLYITIHYTIQNYHKKKTNNKIIPHNKKLHKFYNKKHNKKKPFKITIITYINKLLH
ncbi:transposase [Alkalihalophilus marmarensis]|uniref:transposase n=1 Tax=Alkalihalophilus marmarensis TaxID=521377 RepID=UPI0009FB49F0